MEEKFEIGSIEPENTPKHQYNCRKNGQNRRYDRRARRGTAGLDHNRRQCYIEKNAHPDKRSQKRKM
ncbi:hypothetical protein GCM10009000_058650 [Halobacterium noricense]|uniref:Uncharacterized protein n=1 Tax=Haladaptatus pallidirubidus TaxID=1008152 RepID=A0AAV3UKH1_9EURY